MFEENSIIRLFIKNLESKPVAVVSPEKNAEPNKKIKIIYKDNSISEFQTELSHNDFMKEWKVFCDWSRCIHQAQTSHIENWIA
jgi:hypothetical protein